MVNRSKVFVFLKFIVSFGLLAALLWIMRNDVKDIIGILKDSDKLFFSLAFLISGAVILPLAYRLKLLLSGQNVCLSMRDSLYLTFIGLFFNNFFPTAIGGDIAKAYYASKKTNNKAASCAAVVVDRLIGALATLSIAIIGIVFFGKSLNNNRLIAAVVILLTVIILLMLFLLNEKKVNFTLPSPIKKLYTAINFYRHNFGLLLKAYILGVGMQALAVASIFFFVLCIEKYIPFFKLCLIVPIVWSVSMLPSLNGLGVREGAFVYFLKGDIGIESAFAISLLWLGVVILFSIIGGILHLLCPVKVERSAL